MDGTNVDPKLYSMLVDIQAQVHALQSLTMSVLRARIMNMPPGKRSEYVNDLQANMQMHDFPDDLSSVSERQYYVDLSTAIEQCSHELAEFLREEVAGMAARGV